MRTCRPGSSRRAIVPWLLASATALTASLLPHTQPAVASPIGSSDPPAPPPLAWPAKSPILDCEEVGYLPGAGAVTAGGEYQYTLPIDVPDGRAGMEPDVALRYS